MSVARWLPLLGLLLWQVGCNSSEAATHTAEPRAAARLAGALATGTHADLDAADRAAISAFLRSL